MILQKAVIEDCDELVQWNSNALEFYTSIGFTLRFIGMRMKTEKPE